MIHETKKKGLTKNQFDKWLINNPPPIRPEKPYNTKLEFFDTYNYNGNLIKFDNVSFSYENNHILDNISFGIDMESKITLVGLNGCGKSTIIKLIMNEITPKCGEIIIKDNIRIGYYNQHFDQQLPFDRTPVEFLINKIPMTNNSENKNEIVRKYLGNMKLDSTCHNKKIGELSGGYATYL